MKNSKTRTGGWEITVARSIEEVELLRPTWEEMQRSEPYSVINADIDQYLSVIEAIGDDVRPHIILINENGRPAAMLIGRIEKRRFEIKLGYKSLLSSKLRCLTIVYGGVVGQMKDQVCRELMSELMAAFTRDGVDALHLNHLRMDSPLYLYARTIPSLWSRGHWNKIDSHWTMQVPESIEHFYKALSKKHRGNLRRSIRKLEKAFENQVRIVTYCNENELEEAISKAAGISCNTYQHALGVGFEDSALTRSMMITAAKKGWLRLSVLFVGEEPCAFQSGCCYGNKYFLKQIGFNPKWKGFDVGTVLFLKVLEDICNQPQIRLFDFGFGDAQYKRSYADTQWQEASVYVFAPRFYPIFVNMLQTFVMGLSVGIKYILKRTGFLAWLKRRWRNLLQRAKKN